MNRQIVRLFGFFVVLFGLLVGFTSYWSVFDAEALRENSVNKRPLFEQQQVRRGRILTADGELIAKSVRKGSGDDLRYVRRYPEGSLYGHPIGYSFPDEGQSEFERFHNATLVDEEGEFRSIVEELLGHAREGDDIVTNIDSDAQRVALRSLEAAGFGAVVALDPRTGAVRAMASNKSFNPNAIPTRIGQMNRNTIETPLLNRATQGLYPPGSTFKVVTAAAGLESGVITPSTVIDAPGTIEAEGHPLSNDFGTSYSGATLDRALTNSINTWFAQLGQKVGRARLFETMEKFGFNSTPPIDLPDDEVWVSGVYEGRRTLDRDDAFDLARLAIGQERLLATPLQMAMVAAAVANGGRLMKPQIWSRVVDPDGRVVRRQEPSEYRRPISAETAADLARAMEGVVREGTGTNAAIPGVPVAGKTGTAETPGNKACGGGAEQNQAWFIGFAPADEPEVAIAVSVECTTQFGGEVAAPIFRAVAEAVLESD